MNKCLEVWENSEDKWLEKIEKLKPIYKEVKKGANNPK